MRRDKGSYVSPAWKSKQLLPAYNYNKFYIDNLTKKHDQTGYILLINKVPHLIVIDIDNKGTSQEQQIQIYHKLLKQFYDEKCYTEVTGNLGLHIFMIGDNSTKTLTNNRYINIINTPEYSIDIFTSANPDKRNGLVISPSRVYNKFKQIVQLRALNNSPILPASNYKHAKAILSKKFA